jgi:acylphosphatase
MARYVILAEDSGRKIGLRTVVRVPDAEMAAGVWDMMTVHARVSGRVQGVFFRAWTRNQALELGLKGWVRNLPDGRVELMAQGAEETLARFLDCLRQGPPLARVGDVESVFLQNEEPMIGFAITR